VQAAGGPSRNRGAQRPHARARLYTDDVRVMRGNCYDWAVNPKRLRPSLLSVYRSTTDCFLAEDHANRLLKFSLKADE